MKQIVLLLILVAAGFAGGALWMKHRGGAPASASAEAKPAEEEAAGPRVSRDAEGRAVVTLSDELQGNMGLRVANPVASQFGRELKGYGRVLDPTPLAALATELAAAEAAAAASSNELARLKNLAGQGNASTRAVQAAEATAQRDQSVVQSARDRLALSWGKAITDQHDPTAFFQSLVSLETALVRVDLPVGEALSQPAGARLSTAAGEAAEVEFLGLAPSVDPQMQGQGFLFRTRPKSLRLLPGQAVVGYLKVPGEPLAGVIIPRDAVVRAEGAGWVYVLGKKDAESFTRTEIALDRPVEAGWFVTNAVAATDYIVVNGAQQLLSVELKGGGSE